MTWTWWMTLLVIAAVLLLIGCIPVGVDARYGSDGVFLAEPVSNVIGGSLCFLVMLRTVLPELKQMESAAAPC